MLDEGFARPDLATANIFRLLKLKPPVFWLQLEKLNVPVSRFNGNVVGSSRVERSVRMPIVQLNRHRQEIDIQQIWFQPLLLGKRDYLLPIVERFTLLVAARLVPKAVSTPKPNEFGFGVASTRGRSRCNNSASSGSKMRPGTHHQYSQ